VIEDRPFTDPAATTQDMATMQRMLGRLRIHVAGLTARPARRDDRFVDETDGAHHTIIVTDVARAGSSVPLTAVGFFGQARIDVDHSPIVELEQQLIAGMQGAGAPLVYHNVWWPGEGWGNLVLFASAEDEASWGRTNPLHIESVRRSPQHYHSIRLHIGVVPDGLAGSSPVRLLRTRLIDYGASPPWRAIREAASPTGPGAGTTGDRRSRR
jgi:hypothetical protein